MRNAKSALPLVLVLLGSLLAPAGAQALPRGFFGIVPQSPIGPEDTSRMRAGGVETIRAPLEWNTVQRRAGQPFDWSYFDAIVAAAARDRIEVLPFLCAPARWASHQGTRLPIDSGRQRRGWSQFVSAAVERYGPRGTFWSEHGPGSAEPLPRVPIHAWQVWNEENFFYFTRPASPTRYARLLKLSHRAIHRVDGHATVVMGGLFGDPGQRPPRAMDADEFLDRLYRVRGVKASFDAIALHPYAADTGDLRRIVESARQVMLRHGDRRAGIYITEMGWGSQHDPRLVSFEVGWRQQARELRSAFRYLIANRHRLNLRQVDWFSWKDATGLCRFCDSVGLFRASARFRPKPAWHAYVHFARRR